MDEEREQYWYRMSREEAATTLTTDMHTGLSPEEAAKRIRQYGPNELQAQPGRTIWSMLLDQFREVMVLMLIGAAIISGLVGEVEDTIIILLIVVLNAILGVVQESKAENSLAALKKLSAPMATVIRGGKPQQIAARELVPGDLIVLDAGTNIPADARLVEAANLRCEEAALTGESVPVEKTVGALEDKDAGIGDWANMVFCGTTTVYGRGKALVVETGMQTQIGRIASMIQAAPQEPTPLQLKLEELGKSLGAVALVLVVLVFLAGLLRGEPAFEMFMTAISLAVAAIPEGLPAIVTIVLALGVQRMIKRQAIIRKLPAVETLGTATVIASDKTGTLTQNEMTVTHLYINDELLGVTGQGYEPKGKFLGPDGQPKEEPLADQHLNVLLHGFSLANDAQFDANSDGYDIIGDPTEGALVVAAAKAGISVDDEGIYPRIEELPFDSRRKRMTTFHKVGNNGTLSGNEALGTSLVSFSKGAPDVLLSLCTHIYTQGEVRTLSDAKREQLLEVNATLGQKALRVLALAFRCWEKMPDAISPETVEEDLVFVGFAGMIDPPRPEVKAAVEVAKEAGIRTVMVTGDHKLTATAIARELGILEREDQLVVSGPELERLTDSELQEMIEGVRVFARVSPEHKVRIVDALKGKGHVVAMTGDGVNDAPALKRADIGASMGITGTDVAKEASEMVLADDNFATIVAAVAEGRTIYSNIRKAIYYLLSCNVGEIFTIFMSIMLGWGRPLTAIQILWINLVTDGLPALALGVEPSETGVMHQKPRSSRESVFAGGMSYRIMLYGCLIGLLGLVAYYLGIQRGAPVAMARSMAFATLAFSQLFQALNARSTESLFRVGLFSNKYMVLALAGSASLQLMVMLIPALQRVFGVVPLDLVHWDLVIGLSIVPVVVGEIQKLMGRS
ncbi:MAG: calcium-translocating P-type ATPase, SERCA-type [Firmicutes bacterium]|jgi:Ca2+-transporting ATPase|nr:calcium-translocating P-type ATPase, SERCA-type [Bacillota bacterium]